MAEGSWVGLHVHARTTLAGVLDAVSGELRVQAVSPRGEEAVAGFQPAAAGAGRLRAGTDRARACACVARGWASPARWRRRRRSRAAAGERVKTDRRDAERLARLLRLGELVPVQMPDPGEEAARDLVRAREDTRGDLMRARHRLAELLLRHGLVYEASACTLADDAGTRSTARSRSSPPRAPFADVVERLVCLRGVSTLTALALTVELGNRQCFRPQSLGPFLGLVPSEHSSGQRRRQGAITKTANTHARRLLDEAAWHQRRPLRASAALERRRQEQPAAVRAPRRCERHRLHRRWHALEGRGKRRAIVAVALARELASHCCALATNE